MWPVVVSGGDPNLLPPVVICPITIVVLLLHGYSWNTGIFPCTENSYLHRAQWYYFYLSPVRTLMSPWLLTRLTNYKRASSSVTRPVLFKSHSQDGFSKIHLCYYIIFLSSWHFLTFWSSRYMYYCLYFSSITLYPSFITFLWQAF